jgi:regulator of RNase E activity RraA
MHCKMRPLPLGRTFSVLVAGLGFFLPVASAEQAKQGVGEATLVSYQAHSPEEDTRILQLFEGLRVADVTDAMDLTGLQDVGLMDPAIHALWRDLENFGHRLCGIAVTARYVPTNKRAGKMTPEEYKKWFGEWYGTISREAFMELLRPGTVLVIDASDDGDTGTIGSFNTMMWKSKGVRGVVTSGGARDTDEIIREKIPLYLKRYGRGVPPGRNEIESVNQPITCGGVLVRPGDVIVADGDGVIVVPREHAEPVAKAAREVLVQDKINRRKMYDKLGIPPDRTVMPD